MHQQSEYAGMPGRAGTCWDSCRDSQHADGGFGAGGTALFIGRPSTTTSVAATTTAKRPAEIRRELSRHPVTQELADRMKAHEPEVLAILHKSRQIQNY
jgi:hypothetical protein